MNHLTRLVARMFCCLVLALEAGTLAAPVRALAQKSGAAALKSHDIVALDEGRRGNEQAHKLRLELIRHPTFARNVNDIVVEFGSARYQDVMDRYIRGEDDSGAAGAVRNGTLSTEEMSTCGVGRRAFLSACVA